MITALLSPPAAWTQLQQRWRLWWDARHTPSDTLTLTQRNVYILPTSAGWMFAGTLLILLVASINYQLNLGYLLTFLLAGAGVVSMQVTHNTLRGLQFHLRTTEPRFAGEAAPVEAVLTSDARRPRHGVGLRLAGAAADTWTWVDVPPLGQTSARLSFVPAMRGRHRVPTILIETRFPLGLFRAWSVWRPAAQVLVYPAPERPAVPLPASRPVPGGPTQVRSTEGGEIEGVRAYRRGDPMKLVVWKKAAKAMETGGELVSRDTSASTASELWLAWQQAHHPDLEARLSRLTAWVVLTDRLGARYGLALPGRELPPGSGESHRRECLEALATWH
jgi:uncharacterized protein (DUF58 family)